MVNYTTQYERMNDAYDKVYLAYIAFEDRPNKTNKQELVKKIQEFNRIKNNFAICVRSTKVKRGGNYE